MTDPLTEYGDRIRTNQNLLDFMAVRGAAIDIAHRIDGAMLHASETGDATALAALRQLLAAADRCIEDCEV